MKAFASILLALLCISVLSQTGGATIRHVPLQYATIQAAINAAVNGDTVLVDEGTYKENIVLTKKITVGSAFVLDGDTSHISRTIIDGSQPHNQDSTAVVTIDGATDTTTVVAGFTITGGKGNQRTIDYPPFVTAYRGGIGIDIAGGGARIHHNIVRANNYTDPTGYIGGAIEVFDTKDKNGVTYAIIEHNTIADNTLVGDEVDGGAFAIGHNAAIRNNLIARNSAHGSTLGIGGGLQIWNGSVIVEANMIMDNSASHDGGGLYAVSVQELGVVPHLVMVNNIFMGNAAGASGGGVFVTENDVAVMMLNNTFTSNTAVSGGSGISIQNGAIVRGLNTILWDTAGTEILTSSLGSLVASHCDIHGDFTGTGNIDADPVFVSGDPMFNLDKKSPCIGRGIDSAQLGGVWCYAPAYDYDGDARHRPVGPQQSDIGAQEEQGIVDVREGHDGVPTQFALCQNYPNPFNPSTTIKFELPRASQVSLSVFDILGREVSVLVNDLRYAGVHEVKFDGSNLASGVYFYRLQAGTYVETRKFILMK